MKWDVNIGVITHFQLEYKFPTPPHAISLEAQVSDSTLSSGVGLFHSRAPQQEDRPDDHFRLATKFGASVNGAGR